MDFTQEILANRRALLDDIDRRIEEALRPFADALEMFLAILFQARLPVDWREQWHAFVADQAAKDFFVEPQSVRELEDWIEAWARFCGLLPRVKQQAVESLSAHQKAGQPGHVRSQVSGGGDSGRGGLRVQQPNDRGVPSSTAQPRSKPGSQNPREQFFNDKLAIAQRHLDEVHRTLAALGHKLDSAKIGEEVDVDSEATLVDELVWRYHDALESARDAWLRDDLSGEANARLLGMLTPATFGLPTYFDDTQAERARQQGLKVSRRLEERNVTMDRIVFGAKTVESIGTAAGFLAGGGILYAAAKKGGRWAVVKTLAVAGAAAVAEQAAEKGARAIGAGDQTITGIRLAAAVITLIVLRRRAATSGNQALAPPATPSAPPKRPLSPQEAKRRAGIAFNKAREKAYPYNEVPIAKSGRGKPYFLDAYDPTKGEIVFRRHTQFSEIQFKTAQAYLREFVGKYPPKSTIADVPSAKGLGGQQLEGKMIFEVPPQWKAVPNAVLDEATRLDIWIRDTNGRIYNPH